MKRHQKLGKVILLAVVTISLLGMLIIPSLNKTSAQNTNEQYVTKLTQTMAEISIASTSAEVSMSVDNLNSFMQERSGVGLSPTISQELIKKETEFLGNKQSGISFDKFVDALTTVGLNRMSQLTDDEVTQVVDVLKGTFDSPSVPEKQKNADSERMLAIRPGYYVMMSKEDAIKQIKLFGRAEAQVMVKGVVRNFIAEQVKDTLSALAKASPEKFGANWDSDSNKPAANLSPTQCFLLTYSLASGDLLVFDSANLAKEKEKLHSYYVKSFGSYPRPEGNAAYGDNGYLYRSPASIFFGEKEQIKLLSVFSRTR